jgi:hypothetical protein
VLPEHACPQNPAGCARRRTRRGSCGRLNAGICAGLSPSKENRDVIRAPQADTARYASAIERGKTTIWECPSFSSVRRAGHGDWSTSRMISVLSDRCKPREMWRRKPSVWTRGLPGGTQATLASVSPAHCLARSRLTLAVRLYGAVGHATSIPSTFSWQAPTALRTPPAQAFALRHDLDYPASRRIDQHRCVIDDRVLIIRHTVFTRNRVKYHAFGGQNVANDDAGCCTQVYDGTFSSTT